MKHVRHPSRGAGAGAQASYALGYNLAIEYLADYEKTWMLDSFRALDARVLAPAGRPLREWLFLEVRAGTAGAGRLSRTPEHAPGVCYLSGRGCYCRFAARPVANSLESLLRCAR
jgi:hypothetical protein